MDNYINIFMKNWWALQQHTNYPIYINIDFIKNEAHYNIKYKKYKQYIIIENNKDECFINKHFRKIFTSILNNKVDTNILSKIISFMRRKNGKKM